MKRRRDRFIRVSMQQPTEQEAITSALIEYGLPRSEAERFAPLLLEARRATGGDTTT